MNANILYTGIIFDNLKKQNIPNIEEMDASVNPLTFEKENAIHYIGGYVLKREKRIKNFCSASAI